MKEWLTQDSISKKQIESEITPEQFNVPKSKSLSTGQWANLFPDRHLSKSLRFLEPATFIKNNCTLGNL